MKRIPALNVQRGTVAIVLLCCIAAGTSWADSWESPEIREYRSANGKYVAKIVPANRNGPATVTVLRADGETEQKPLWTSNLSNEVSPVTALVSDDGRFVVTLDNWHQVGYGDDVVAFYAERGQIKKYTLEEALGDEEQGLQNARLLREIPHSISSRFWRAYSLMFFDIDQETPEFGIWLDWAGKWYVWQLSDGSRVKLAGRTLVRWDEKGRAWSRERLQLPELAGKPPPEVMKTWNEDVQSWMRRSGALRGDKLTACRYLAYLKDPNDRPLLEQTLKSSELDMNLEPTLRVTADRALAIYDGVLDRFPAAGMLRAEEEPSCYLLGTIELEIQLPAQLKRGRVMVWIFPEAVKFDDWPTAKPAHQIMKSLSSNKAIERAAVRLSLPAVTPGRYWAKAVWDRPAFCQYKPYGYDGRRRPKDPDDVGVQVRKGDFESKSKLVFEVTAGETTKIKLDCRDAVVSASPAHAKEHQR